VILSEQHLKQRTQAKRACSMWTLLNEKLMTSARF
jgi:hypothetical protein